MDVLAFVTSLQVKTTKKSEFNPIDLPTYQCSGFPGTNHDLGSKYVRVAPFLPENQEIFLIV